MIRDETGDVQVRFELHMTPIDEGLIPQKINALFRSISGSGSTTGTSGCRDGSRRIASMIAL